jgi:glycosyltransferase involved in cell wall biosynthesis
MTVSVIIPTYNGAHKMPHVLAALAQQTVQDFEVIVVIDGSTDGTAASLQAWQSRFERFRLIEQPNGGRAQVRNRGAAAAAGDLLIFFDDDMRPGPDAVRQHMAHHEAHPGSMLTGGQIEELVPDMPDFLRFKAGLSRKWAGHLSDPAKPMTKDQAFLTAANCSMAKATFEALGGFDERLTDAEDYDLAVRAIRQGIELYADPGIHAWHDDKVSCASYIRRLRQYTAAQEKLVALKPELYGGATKYTAPPPTGLKRLFFSSFCSPAMIRSIDGNKWRWLPESLRYRLYDYVVTANGSLFPGKVAL